MSWGDAAAVWGLGSTLVCALCFGGVAEADGGRGSSCHLSGNEPVAHQKQRGNFGMRMWPWDQGSHGLLWWRECGSGGESPEPPPACAGARIKPPPAGASLWPVPLVEEVAVTGRAALGAGVG